MSAWHRLDGEAMGGGGISVSEGVKPAGEAERRIRVVFIIRRFDRGGAERQLIALLRALDKALFEIRVITLYGGGALWEEAAAIPCVRLVHLGKKGRWHLGVLGTLWRHLRDARPHIVHGYMDVANILALAGRMRGAKVVWGVRGSNVDMSRYDYMRRIGQGLEARLAKLPDLIICNSRAGWSEVKARGFPTERTVIIPNGIDTERFRTDPESRRAVRGEWRVAPEEFLVGIVGRLDPMKGHAVFLHAARQVLERYAQLRFVLVGDGRLRDPLRELAGQLGIQDRLIWAGERGDMPAVFPALDLTVSASLFGEGFSNVLAESMACGVPCVATDVGDASAILGEFGWSAPPGDPVALAESICRAKNACERSAVDPDLLRGRIVCNYGTGRLADMTAAALGALIASPGA